MDEVGVFVLFEVLAALSDDAESVVLEVSKAVGATLDELHFSVEALCDAVVFGEAPHGGDGLDPVVEGLGEGDERWEGAGREVIDEGDERLGQTAAVAFGLPFVV